MRPYLAIIKDSFREAFASRVLWVLLILITVFLAALAPFGFRSEQTTEFRTGDFADARSMAREIIEQYNEGPPSPGYRIASRLDSETRGLLESFGDEDKERSSSYFVELGKIVDGLNGLLEQRDLYQEEDWQEVLLGSEARELIDRDRNSLTEIELARLNRLLIEEPFEEYFRTQPPKQVVFTYFGGSLFSPVRVSERRVKQIIEQLVLPNVIAFLVGVIGVFIAILVTASIIPQMFDQGSLSLLLSKPISRSLMFLAKFAGGCAFIFINVTYLVVGLWAIAGLRFDIWSRGLLLCIPIFLFLFAIYYSVSALSGVIWRNAIICVVMAALFWLACTIVGAAKNVFEQFVVEAQKINRLVQAGDTLIAVDEQGTTKYWNAETREWDDTFIETSYGPMARVLGPIYDQENETLLAAQTVGNSLFRAGRPLLMGKASDGWLQEDGPSLPDGTFELLPDPHGRLLAITPDGVQKLADDFTNKKKVKVFFMEIPQSIGKPFQAAGPESALKLDAPYAAAVDPVSGNVVIYSRAKLMLLTLADDKYSLDKTVDVEADEEEVATMAFGGTTVLLALGDGRVLEYEAPELKLRQEYVPESASQARFVFASPDGTRFAILFHNGRLHMLNHTEQGQSDMELADVRGQGDISAVLFESNDTMLVVDRVKRVTEYQLDSYEIADSFAPSLTPVEIAYHYAILPIYTVFPKPGELGNTITYLIQQEETIDIPMQGNDLQSKRARIRPWAPVRSSFIFVVIVLGIACVYIERQDF